MTAPVCWTSIRSSPLTGRLGLTLTVVLSRWSWLTCPKVHSKCSAAGSDSQMRESPIKEFILPNMKDVFHCFFQQVTEVPAADNEPVSDVVQPLEHVPLLKDGTGEK